VEAQLLSPVHIITPVWESPSFTSALGSPVLLKMEAFQPVGSFKARAMGAVCEARRAEGATRIVCASGGNAGYAVAYASRRLGMAATIVIPYTATQRAMDLIRGEGAELLVHGASFDDAQVRALELVAETGAAYAHPFDDPAAWRGNATLVDELAEAGVKPAAMVISVGGGGLLAGLVEGMHRRGWNDIPILAVETDGAASLAAAMQAGQVATLDRITSIATTLSAQRVCQRALDVTRKHPVMSHVVSDRDAVDACLRFADEHRVLVEPACGASLAAVYAAHPLLRGRDPVLAVVCGGAGVTREQLARWDREVAR
jgi:L-serine/L-threonine ammonia-lyase